MSERITMTVAVKQDGATTLYAVVPEPDENGVVEIEYQPGMVRLGRAMLAEVDAALLAKGLTPDPPADEE